MFCSCLSFGHYRTDINRILWILILPWTFSLLLGMFLSFRIVPSVSIDVTSLFDNGPSVVPSIVSLAVFVFAPSMVLGVLGANLFLVLFWLVYKGILAGFFLATMLVSFDGYAWLVNCLLQTSEALCMTMVFMLWSSCLLSEVKQPCKFYFLPLVLCVVVLFINSICISPLIQAILSSVI